MKITFYLIFEQTKGKTEKGLQLRLEVKDGSGKVGFSLHCMNVHFGG